MESPAHAPGERLALSHVPRISNTYLIPQVAIALIAAQRKEPNNPVIPIPGCTTVSRVEENYTQVSLAGQDLEGLFQLVEKMIVHGNRNPEPFKKYMIM